MQAQTHRSLHRVSSACSLSMGTEILMIVWVTAACVCVDYMPVPNTQSVFSNACTCEFSRGINTHMCECLSLVRIGVYVSTQTLVNPHWAGPSVIAHLAPDSTPEISE